MATPVSVHARPQPDLTSLAERIRCGDRAAEAEFLRLYASGVRAVVRCHCRRGEPQVDDLAQEILESLLARLRAGSIVDLQALPHYLRVSIGHACADYYRQLARRDQDAGQREPMPSEADPVTTAQRMQLRDAMRAVIGGMPVRRDRQLLRRFYLDDLDRELICAELNIDASHFRRVIHRARLRLVEALARIGITEMD